MPMNNAEIQEVNHDFTIDDWGKLPPTLFSMEKEYEEQVVPLIKAVSAKCDELGLPILVKTVTAQEDGGHTISCFRNLGQDISKLPPDFLAFALVDELNIQEIRTMMEIMALGTRRPKPV